MRLHWIDFAVLTIYFIGLVAMGLYFSRRNKSTEEYFLGGRSFSGWIIGLSLVGTSLSSATFLAMPADAFKTTWLRFLPNLMLIPVVLIAARFFLPFFRASRVTSAYEYLEGRFGPSVRVYAGSAFIVAQLFRVSMVLYLVSLVTQQITGLDITTCILVSGVLVAFYTIVGGIDAVIWTDVIQTIVLAVGALFCLGIIVYALPGGLGQIIEVGMADGKFAFADVINGQIQPVSWTPSLTEKTATMLLLVGLVIFLTEYCSSQNVVQRYCASRSTREAKKAMYCCAAASVPMWAFFMFLGTGLYVYFQQFPTLEAQRLLTASGGAEQVMPYFIIEFVPRGITGLVIGAALAAAMSSLDSSINAIATVSVVDIYRRHISKQRTDRHYLYVAWVVATMAAIIMVCGAILLAHTKTHTLQHTSVVVVSFLGGGMLGIYLLGFFTRRGDARAVWSGIACTSAFTVWTLVPNSWLPNFLDVPFDLYYTIIIGNIVMFVVGFLAASLLPYRGRDLRNLTIWDRDDMR